MTPTTARKAPSAQRATVCETAGVNFTTALFPEAQRPESRWFCGTVRAGAMAEARHVKTIKSRGALAGLSPAAVPRPRRDAADRGATDPVRGNRASAAAAGPDRPCWPLGQRPPGRPSGQALSCGVDDPLDKSAACGAVPGAPGDEATPGDARRRRPVRDLPARPPHPGRPRPSIPPRGSANIRGQLAGPCRDRYANKTTRRRQRSRGRQQLALSSLARHSGSQHDKKIETGNRKKKTRRTQKNAATTGLGGYTSSKF